MDPKVILVLALVACGVTGGPVAPSDLLTTYPAIRPYFLDSTTLDTLLLVQVVSHPPPVLDQLPPSVSLCRPYFLLVFVFLHSSIGMGTGTSSLTRHTQTTLTPESTLRPRAAEDSQP
jgi:hypothetical protein